MGRARDAEIDRIMALALARCEQRGARMTAQRRSILELLLRRRSPLTAYELRDELARLRRRTVSPVTVYRVLEFLVQQGLVAHLARRGAYLACSFVDREHAHLVFVCTDCGAAVERADPATDRRVLRAASTLGFAPEPVTVEIDGVCGDCRAPESRSATRPPARRG